MPRHISRSMLQSIQGGPGRRRRGHPGRFHHSCLPPLFPQQHLSNFSSYHIFPAAEQQVQNNSFCTIWLPHWHCNQLHWTVDKHFARLLTLTLNVDQWVESSITHKSGHNASLYPPPHPTPWSPYSTPWSPQPTPLVTLLNPQPGVVLAHAQATWYMMPPTCLGGWSHEAYSRCWWWWTIVWPITRGLLMIRMMATSCLGDHIRLSLKVITRVWPSQGLTTPADNFRANCKIEISDAIHYSLGALFQWHINSAV